jgi:ABC-type antimicrobial peptide transport system permease subunit
MKNWHLYPFRKGITDDKPVRMARLVGIIGLFVFITCLHQFYELSTARSEKRAKEVGIRKTIGSMRKQLLYQFYSESLLVVIVSFFLSCVLVSIFLPWFNGLSGKEMSMPLINPYFWLISIGFILITSMLAGSYPALYLSSFKPIKVLKGIFVQENLQQFQEKHWL